MQQDDAANVANVSSQFAEEAEEVDWEKEIILHTVNTSVQQYYCRCGKSCTSKQRLLSHIKNYHKNYECKICGRCCKSNRGLIQHKQHFLCFTLIIINLC